MLFLLYFSFRFNFILVNLEVIIFYIDVIGDSFIVIVDVFGGIIIFNVFCVIVRGIIDFVGRLSWIIVYFL